MTKKKIVFTAICFIIFTVLLSACSSSDLINSYRYKISDKELSLKVGDGHSVSIIGTNAEDSAKMTVEWSSSDERVASVDESGFVVGNSEGKATVTAKVTSSDVSVSYICSVKVEKNGISLSKFGYSSSEIEIVKGQTYSPRVTVYPGNADNKNYTVTSSDENIVSVSADGKITGVAVGTAVITAKTDDGSFSSTATVTVSEEKNLANSITLNKDSLNLTEGDSEQLVAKITPANLGLEITWSSSDPSVASVSSKGVVTAKSEGKAVITATVHDILSDKTASCEVTVEDKDSEIKATGLTFETDTVTIINGDPKIYNFKATVTPATTTNVVSWSSSNSSLVYVNSKTGDFQLNGTVTETTKVTLTCRVGAISKKGTVIIKPAEEKLPTVTVTPTMKKSFNVGEKATLSLSFSPDISAAERKQLIVSFDDSFTEYFNVSANEVGEYTITARKEGSGVLRFSVSTSSGRYEYKTETVSFTIGETGSDDILVISTDNALSLKVGESSDKWFSLKKNGISVSAAEAGVIFSSTDSNVASVDASGKITAHAAGKATVSVTDGKVTRSVTVTVTVAENVTHSLSSTSSTVSAESPVTFTVEVGGGEIDGIAVELSDSVSFSSRVISVGKTTAEFELSVKEGAAPTGTVTVTVRTTLKNGQTVTDTKTITVE